MTSEECIILLAIVRGLMEPVMTNANTELRQMAIQIANDLDGRNLHLGKEIQNAELHVAELKLELEASRMARQRSRDFSPALGSDFRCPECWVRRGIETTLIPRDSPDEIDIYVCKTCSFEFSFSP